MLSTPWLGAKAMVNEATGFVTVLPVNDAPLAGDDAYATDEDTVLVVPAGLLANDLDPEGELLTAVLLSGPAHGALALEPDGSFTYAPDPNFFGADSFSYRATDESGASDLATVLLTVNPI